jgi:hypothetical protein
MTNENEKTRFVSMKTSISLQCWCKHYNAMAIHAICEAGVDYASLPSFQRRNFSSVCPCFGPNRGSCDKAEYPTPEELVEAEKLVDQQFENVDVARGAILNEIGPWREGIADSGRIDCPICKMEKSLAYSRSKHNGHIHGNCATKNCVNWME